MRKATGDASLIYKGNFPRNIKPKIKHLITEKEIINYTNYLKEQELYISLLITELLYKFGFRVGAIAKLKVKNLSNNNNLVLLEKNSEVITRNLLDITAEKIRSLIKIQKINDNDYIFFPHTYPNDERKRTKFLSYYIKKTMIDSKAFPKNDLENISAHCFRATLAVKTYKQEGAIEAQKALNHKNINTTLSHYIKINDRGIDINEEKKYKNNKILNSAFNFFENYSKDDSDSSSSINSDLSDDYSEDNNRSNNLDDEETLFKLNINNIDKKEKIKFLERKRKSKNKIITNSENKNKNQDSKKFFDSILQDLDGDKLKEKENIKKILLECGRNFIPKIEAKKIQYQYSKFAKNRGIQNSLSNKDITQIKEILSKNENCLYDNILLKKLENRYFLFAKNDIQKNEFLLEATGFLILENEFKSIKFKKNDPYIQYIPFFKTKNKLRNRILLTHKIGSIVIYLNLKPLKDKSTNSSFYLYNDEEGFSHLILRATKKIKIGEMITINEEELKIE